METFYCDGKIIRDEQGRHRIFKGINVCVKTEDKSLHQFKKTYCTKKHFDMLTQNGFNIVRLGICWDLIEPLENEYSMQYIDAFKEYVALCAERNIYVMLDMHQDLFSYYLCDVGDGAPLWALEGFELHQKPHAIWAEGYFYMDSVQKAFHDFWHNEKAIQDKYIKMWSFFAKQFEEFPNVIAYDYMNEPYVEKNGRKIFLTVIKRVVKQTLQKDIQAETYFKKYPNKKAFKKLFLKIVSYVKTLGRLKKIIIQMDSFEEFGKAVAGLEAYTDDFNHNYYAPFIEKISKAINSDEKHFNVIEHNYYSNLGIPFSITPPKNCLYSPHAYDIFVDSPLYNKYSSKERIKFITSSIRENQNKMNLPVLFGEWGSGANGSEWLSHIDYVNDIMEQNLWSNIYWGYEPHMHKLSKLLTRPYPVAIHGTIHQYHTDIKSKTFRLEWECDTAHKDNLIYMPKDGFIHIPGTPGINVFETKF